MSACLELNPYDYARVHIDFEAYSECDIEESGGYLYAIDPTTEILCCAFAPNAEFVRLLTPSSGFNWELYWLALNPTVKFVAHNAGFEQDIWEHKMVPLGYPPIPIHRWVCTMAKCDANGIPGALGTAGMFLNLQLQKDPEGKRLINLLCKPRKATKKDARTRITLADAPQEFQNLYNYCIRDVETERELDLFLPDLDPEEQETWVVDQEINRRGLQLDMVAVNAACNLVEINRARNVVAFQSRLGINPTQRDKVKTWLASRGVNLRDMQAPTLEEFLSQDNVPQDIREVLEIYAESNRNSLAKYRTMRSASDRQGIVRRHLRYHRAHTGRWAGLLVQFQNLVRASIRISTAVAAIKALSFDSFAWVYGDASEALASAVRGMVIARPNHRLLMGDQSQIEALVIAWLSGQESTLEVKRNGQDLYCASGPAIFGKEITKADVDERQTCKAAVLGSGFGGGVGALKKTLTQHGVSLKSVVERIWATTTYHERAEAERGTLLYFKRTPELDRLPRNEALVADVIKQRWRRANPCIESFWHELEDAAIECVRSGRPVQCRRVVFFIDGIFLRCRLPSGRTLAYPYPKLTAGMRGGQSLYYRSSDPKTKYHWVKTWGGTLAENITQAVARDLMVYSMKLLRAEGYNAILTVHDELACEVLKGFGSLERFKYLMGCLPWWGVGIPLEIEAHESERYGKKEEPLSTVPGSHNGTQIQAA